MFTVRSQPLGAITVSPDGRVQATSAKPSWLVQQRLVVPCCSWELSFQQCSNADNSSTMELLCRIVDYFATMNMTNIDVYTHCQCCRCYVLMGHILCRCLLALHIHNMKDDRFNVTGNGLKGFLAADFLPDIDF